MNQQFRADQRVNSTINNTELISSSLHLVFASAEWADPQQW